MKFVCLKINDKKELISLRKFFIDNADNLKIKYRERKLYLFENFER